jgi:serine/threonine-protein kinase
MPSVPPPPPPIKKQDDEPVELAAIDDAPPVKNSVDIDWDDEDEATQIFDRSQDDGSSSLLRSAPPGPAAGAPPPARRMSSPVPAPMSRTASRASGRPLSMPPPSMPPPRSMAVTQARQAAAPAMAAPNLISDMPFARSRNTALLVAAAAVAVVIVGVVFLLLPKDGSLVVTVAGPGNTAVNDLEVYVDGKKRCTSSPCRVESLASGTHLVKVSGTGFEPTADQGVKVEAGDEAVYNVVLSRGGAMGLSVKAEGRGLRLWIDGKEVGPLPQEISDITPGEHTIKIDGSERYEPLERTVTIEPNQPITLEPKLKVRKGLATIKPGTNAEGATVMLVSGTERRPVPQLPLAVDIQVDKPYRIVATKPGYRQFEQKIEFEDGQAERTFIIDLSTEATASLPPISERSSSGMGSGSTSRSTAPAPAPRSASASSGAASGAAKTGGSAKLNFNSIPASNVILDGKPLGGTPKTGITVEPGMHTVIFVHPEHGRKAKGVNAQAGKTISVVAKFE